MNAEIENLQELAALHSLGALDADDARAFSRLLAESADATKQVAALSVVVEELAKSLPARQPSPGLRDRILRQAAQSQARANMEAHLRQLLPLSKDGFAFIKEAASAGWLPLHVSGASVKLLSLDEEGDYALVLGKLEAGARYPSHAHQQAESVFMLSGDLHIGDEVIHGGDFHHADAGSRHAVNWSQTGCVLLAVLSKEDLLAQFAAH
jgi:anti-sigma factor ChrR (cupin superfamily)